MKLSLPSVLLSSVFALPAMALLNSTGALLSVDIPASTLVGIYTAIMLVALMLADYSRRAQTLRSPVQSLNRNATLLPVEAIVGSPRTFVSLPRSIPSAV